MRTRTFIRAGILAAAATGFVVAGSGPASADHTHVMVRGNGDCVVLAGEGGETDVALPASVFDSNPNVDVEALDGLSHPLHVLVHKGVPGEHRSVYVDGSAEALAACADYLNR